MRGIVWGSTSEIAKNKLLDIIEKYKDLDIKPLTEKSINSSKHGNCFAEFENGDFWRSVSAGDHARGHACHISYIDVNIPQDIVDCIIKPCTKLRPYTAFHYYGEKIQRSESKIDNVSI